ncbi:MAG TPA: HupE/UreJ family protein, partial [Ferruginibacter sp.]|nr:HupE/UreJ family protein [Ferruginibacter sp.]
MKSLKRYTGFYKIFFLFCTGIISVLIVQAHTINYDLEKAPLRNILAYYFNLGVRHIIPDGLDHILFISGLCLLSTKIKPIIWQATAFTVAHCITLFLSMKNLIVA